MNTNPNIIPYNEKDHIEKIGAPGVFEEKIMQWIEDYKNGSLSKEDVLDITKKVAGYRNTPSLVEEIKQQLN
ncbi:MAG: hypothetical protein Q8P80_02935 [Candidatus Levybacteria bacterium]|nr:hypothetical protein [Candidatus Levybacteria bacterium]